MTDIGRLLKEAESLYSSDDFAEALDALEGIKEIITNVEPLPRAQFHRLSADILVELGRYEDARSEVMMAYNLLRGRVVSLELARTQRTRGRVLHHLGEVQEAERSFHDAIGTLRCIEDKEDVSLDMVGCLVGVAFVSHVSSCWSEALKHLKKALHFCRSDRERGVIIGNLGIVYLKTGFWAQAEEHLERSLDYGESCKDLIGTCRTCISLGKLAAWRRQKDKTKRLLDRARLLSHNEGYRREMALSLEALGEWAFIEGELDTALAYYRGALKIGEEIAPNGDIIEEVQRQLGELLVALGRLDEAECACERALEIARKLGDKCEEACVYRVRALIAEQRKDHDLCSQYLDQSIQQLKTLGERYELSKSLFAKGRFILTHFPTERQEGLSLLGEAQKLLGGTMNATYDQGMILVEEARWRIRGDTPKDAWRPLREAEGLFEEIRSKAGLELVANVEEELKKAEDRSRRRTMNQYEILKRLSHASDREMRELFHSLAEHLEADRGIMAFRSREGYQIDGCYGLNRIDACGLLERLSRELDAVPPGEPLLYEGGRVEEKLPSLRDEPAMNMMFMPLGIVNGNMEAILYLDRLDGCGNFSQQMVDFFGVFGKMLGGRMAQLQQGRLRGEIDALRQQLAEKEGVGRGDIVAESPRMMEVISKIDCFKDFDLILLLGETGVGKDLLAKAIHYWSPKWPREFVEVNCAALPENLLESTLFGYVKGAFTDARRDRLGLFHRANGGTIFLNEIGDMSLSLQAKLLRVVEKKEFEPVGGNKTVKVDLRVIAATNKNLEEEIKSGRFRDDLYHRLKMGVVSLAPLRERKEDILPLARRFVEHSCRREGYPIQEISPGAMEVLRAYSWPGNVRELRNEMERAVVMAKGRGVITRKDLSEGLRELSGENSDLTSLKEKVRRFELELIHQALRDHEGSTSKAAGFLGLSRRGLQKKMERYGMSRGRRTSVHVG